MGKEDWKMDCDYDIRSEKSWWDWLESEPGLYCTMGTILTVSVALYLLIYAN